MPRASAMNNATHLHAIEVGCVHYLNAKPLIYGCGEEIYFDHPSKLAEMLAACVLDVALVPSFAAMSNPGCKIVDGVAIASAGEVFSVFLAYRGRLKDVRQVSLDISSLTSANLLRCVLAEFHGMHPQYLRSDECDDPEVPKLLIGNHAINFRRANGAEFNYLDLGAEWSQHTELPFVYALWLIRPNVLHPEAIAGELRRMKADGMEHIEDIIRTESEGDIEFRRNYLRKYIHYTLGEPEKSGLRKYRDLLVKHGLIAGSECCFTFV